MLVTGARAPKLVNAQMIREMRDGAVVVDVAIDQGGCFETSRPTTHAEPTYVHDGVVHYCVTNMPGAVPLTATRALSDATLPRVLAIAEQGLNALRADPHLLAGLNIHRGQITEPQVSGRPCPPPTPPPSPPSAAERLVTHQATVQTVPRHQIGRIQAMAHSDDGTPAAPLPGGTVPLGEVVAQPAATAPPPPPPSTPASRTSCRCSPPPRLRREFRETFALAANRTTTHSGRAAAGTWRTRERPASASSSTSASACAPVA